MSSASRQNTSIKYFNDFAMGSRSWRSMGDQAKWRRWESTMNLQKEGCCFALCSPQVGFPWVVQLDCSEDANTYIHRVGRTARYEENGKASLFLLPSGNFILEVPPDKEGLHPQIQVNPKKVVYVLLDYLQSNSRSLTYISFQTQDLWRTPALSRNEALGSV